MNPFHLAFPVSDLQKTREFYVHILGCSVGRSAPRWIDFNFFGHQLSAHLKPEEISAPKTNAVDGDSVPVRHFGVVLAWDQWKSLATNLENRKYPFRIKPKVRFTGQVGEQGTFFVDDPSGNCLEFKTFKNMDSLFAR